MVQNHESFWGGVRGGPFCKKGLPGNSSRNSQVLKPFLAIAQVHPDDPRIALDFSGVPRAISIPESNATILSAEPRRYSQVVFYQQDGRFESPPDFHDSVGRFFFFFGCQTCNGLVQHEQLRLQGEGTPQLDAFARRMGNPRPLFADMPEDQKINDLFHHSAVPQFLFSHPQQGMDGVFSELDVPAEKQVVKDIHVQKKPEVLKRSSNPSHCYEHRGEPFEALPFELNLPGRGLVYTPEIQLNRVVLPDPLGPITVKISSSWTCKSTPDRARMPPKLIKRLLTSNSAMN